MAEMNSIRLITLLLFGSLSYPFHVNQESFTCDEQVTLCLNALSNSIVNDIEFREFANDYFDQWNSTSKYSTEFEDFIESLEEEPELANSNYINIAIDTLFNAAYKPTLGFPYQYPNVDMEKVAEAGTERHSITQQPLKSTNDILEKSSCKIDSLKDINNRIIFGVEELVCVNVYVSEYFKNNKYGCVEFSFIPSRMAQVMNSKKNFDSYYYSVTCFINLKSKKIEFHTIGTNILFYGPYRVTDTLAVFDNSNCNE